MLKFISTSLVFILIIIFIINLTAYLSSINQENLYFYGNIILSLILFLISLFLFYIFICFYYNFGAIYSLLISLLFLALSYVPLEKNKELYPEKYKIVISNRYEKYLKY